jgi:hypothetical protein
MALVAGCASNPDTVAGSAGAGNPGGTVSLAIIADSGEIQSLQKRATPCNIFLPPIEKNDLNLPIVDDGNLTVDIDEAYLTVESILFQLDQSDDVSELLSEVDNEKLSAGTEGLVLKGPFIFDALTGESNPSVDAFSMPETDYTGIKLYIGPGSGEKCAIDISGTFEYESSIREFALCLSLDVGALYKKTGAPFRVLQKDTTHIAIILDAARWLSGIEFKKCLDNGLLPLDSEGNLTITDNSGSAFCSNIDARIRVNIITTGRLKTSQD